MPEIKSYAKINLSLKILGKNAQNNPQNGYHYISSIFAKVPLHDVVVIEPNKAPQNTIIFKNNDELNAQNNITKTLDILRKTAEEHSINLPFFNIEITKNIPLLSGLGGGSCNAAVVVDYIFTNYFIGLDAKLKTQICMQIGADVAFFAQQYSTPQQNNFAFCHGYGQIIEPLLIQQTLDEFFDIFIFKIKPHLYQKPSTQAMYKAMQRPEIANYQQQVLQPALQFYEQIKNLTPQQLTKYIANDFAPLVINPSLEIKTLCDFLKINKITHGLSGSGPSIFALTPKGKFIKDDFCDLTNDFDIF